ncbi:MAG: hypothetical protein HGA61_03105 [Candidatus Moranbacteria bacterium]|nr:hypothetical protein [Candidatus Moranbacteria bacterium]
MENKEKNDENLNHGEWKNLIQGFIGNVFERLSDNVLVRIQNWSRQLKRRALGSIIMVLGVTYLLTGLSAYFESVLGILVPGLGYAAIGILAFLAGYLLSKK